MGNLRDEQLARTRERILDATARIMARDITKLSIQEIVRESGVSRPTVYRHFDNKKAIVQAISERAKARRRVPELRTAETLAEAIAIHRALWKTPVAREERAALWAAEDELQIRRGGLDILRELVARDAAHLPAEDRERAAKILRVLFSGDTQSAFERIVQAPGEEAVEICIWAAARILGVEIDELLGAPDAS